MKKVLTNVRYTGPLWEQLQKACAPAQVIRAGTDDLNALREGLKEADVAILQTLLPPEEIKGPNLRWLHITHAGIDRVARPEFFERGIKISGSAGYSVETMAEHALFFMLSLTYRSADPLLVCGWSAIGAVQGQYPLLITLIAPKTQGLWIICWLKLTTLFWRSRSPMLAAI